MLRIKIAASRLRASGTRCGTPVSPVEPGVTGRLDRKSTRLNSSHLVISYAVFCLIKNRLHGPWSSSHAESRQLHIQLTGGPCASPQNGTPPAPLSPTCPEHVPLVDLFEKLDMQGDYKSRRTTIGAVTFANTPGEACTP